MNSKTIIISGASGFIGRYLTTGLIDRGYDVKTVSFAQNKKTHHGLKTDNRHEPGYWENAYAVINLSGKSIISPWTKNNMREIVYSRIHTTQSISDIISSLNKPPVVFISASAVGYYGAGNQICTEDSPGGNGFLADTCDKWEQAIRVPDQVRTCRIRIGNVFGKNGGMLSTLNRITKAGLSAVNGNGKQFISWISIDDVLEAIDLILNREQIAGAVNFTTPEPVSNADFTRRLCKKLHRPLLFRIPAPFLNLMPNGMGRELFLGGIRAMPEKLQSHGFSFKYPTLDSYFNSR